MIQKTFRLSIVPAIVCVGAIAMIAIIGLGMTGCKQPTDSTPTYKATDDFNITLPLSSGTDIIADGNPKAVSIAPKAGKVTGTVTNIRYEGIDGTTYPKSTNPPTEAGKYKVTFDVGAAEGFSAKTGVVAGTFTIKPGSPITPTAAHFTITGAGTVTYDGQPKAVSITRKSDNTTTGITIYYQSATYPKSTTAPSAAGTYTVTFDVTAYGSFTEKAGLSAGTLTISAGGSNPATDTDFKKTIDFEDGAWKNVGYNSNTAVTSGGYNWSARGFGNVSSTDTNNNGAIDHFAGTGAFRLRSNTSDTVNNFIEMVSYITAIKSIYFDYASFGRHTGGVVILYYQKNGETTWTKVDQITAEAWDGTMKTVKFDLNITGGVRFKLEKPIDTSGTQHSVNIDNIIITNESEASFDKITAAPVDPAAGDFSVTGLEAIANGTPREVTITSLTGKSQGIITKWYEGTAGTTYTKSHDAPSAAGSYAVTFDVAADTANGFNAKTGLVAGTLVITEITGPHILINFDSDEWAGIGYTDKEVTSGGYTWTANGYTTMSSGYDRYDGDRSLRLRGTTGDKCRIEMSGTSYLPNGIKSISFDYGTYGNQAGGGILVVYYQKEGGNWVEAGKVENIPSWVNGGSKFQKANIPVNQTGKVRFKIAREGNFQSTSTTTTNIDNIIVTYDE